jgi:hypothetical protein
MINFLTGSAEGDRFAGAVVLGVPTCYLIIRYYSLDAIRWILRRVKR